MDNRISDVGREELNFIGPIDNLFDTPLCSFETSLSRLNSSDKNLKNHSNLSKLFAKDKLFNNPNERLTVDEIAAINLYTREWDPSIYKPMNIALRKEDRSVLHNWFPFLRLLFSGLLKTEKFSGELWRGTNVNLSNQYKKGRKIFWWSFSSCTLNSSVLKNFLGQTEEQTMFYIECIRGYKIKNYSSIPIEDEVVLLPGSYFQVTDNVNLGNNLIMIKLQQINPDEPIFEINGKLCICGLEIESSAQSDHDLVCYDAKIQCINGCQKMCTRIQLSNHLQKCCRGRKQEMFFCHVCGKNFPLHNKGDHYCLYLRCPFYYCQFKTISVKALEHHKINCKNNIVTCIGCGGSIHFSAYYNHKCVKKVEIMGVIYLQRTVISD